MERLTRLLAAKGVSGLLFGSVPLIEDIPACSSLPSLLLESANSLLSPLGSHLRSNSTAMLLVVVD
jgi:hypothetical protein